MKKKLIEQAKLVPAFNPVTESATAIKGTAIDKTGYLSVIAMAGVGAVSGTPDSFTVIGKLQESDTTTDGDFSDVTGYTLSTLSAINTNTNKGFDLTGLKKYIRLVVTPAFTGGTTPKAYLTGGIVLGDAVVEPVS